MKTLILIGTFFLSFMTAYAQKLVVYPAPEGAILNSDFTVRVRQAGQEWKQLPSI